MRFTDNDLKRLKKNISACELDPEYRDLRAELDSFKAMLYRMRLAEKALTARHTEKCWTAKGLTCICRWGDFFLRWQKIAGKIK